MHTSPAPSADNAEPPRAPGFVLFACRGKLLPLFHSRLSVPVRQEGLRLYMSVVINPAQVSSNRYVAFASSYLCTRVPERLLPELSGSFPGPPELPHVKESQGENVVQGVTYNT